MEPRPAAPDLRDPDLRAPDQPAPDQPDADILDMVIVGAGISGLGMALHLARALPHKRYAVLERRARIGGTWDLFRYPGVRSDSDMYTLGFASEPWRSDVAVADGEAIRQYLEDVAARRGIARHIRFGRKVLTADWNAAQGAWTLIVQREDGACETVRARFLYVGAGFYDHDAAHDPQLPGLASFTGDVAWPQFWPQDLDVAGKRIVVIGSGATAATLVPALARQGAAKVTLLQRTPSWYFSHPSRDGVARWLYRLLPQRMAYAALRRLNAAIQGAMFARSRRDPDGVGRFLRRHLAKHLPDHHPAEFTAPYGPWVQRLCLIPDGDLFAALRSGDAAIVTGRIAGIEDAGVRLEDGRVLAADIVVPATGLTLARLGKIAFSLDGVAVDFAETFHYRSCMFSNVPNFAALFGYLNAAWTLRVDAVAPWLCRLLAQMDAWEADVVVPHLPADHGLVARDDPFHGFTSGWLKRARHLVPKSAANGPWRLGMDHAADCRELAERPIDDGVLRFARVPDKRMPNKAAVAPASQLS